MTDYTARNVLLKDANGNYLIPYTEKADLSLSNLNATGEAHFQAPLVSGTNIKTINGSSVLGSGDLTVTATITGGASTIVTDNLTASKALVSNSNGKVAASSVTSTELEYLSGVTSAIQTQINDKVNKDLSNLTSAGEAHFANPALTNTGYTTNRILEIPQDIKLELNNGTLTLKAGSKVYVPNGFESDGTMPKFDTYIVPSDLTRTHNYNNTRAYYLTEGKVTSGVPLSMLHSGSSAPTNFGQWAVWYDTANNLIKYTSNSGSTWIPGFSFPFCIATSDTTQIVSIDQVFNGFGYIGSTVFILPGVKVQAPNGKNEDGTYKSNILTQSSVGLTTFTSNANGALVVRPNSSIPLFSAPWHFDSENGYISTSNNIPTNNGGCILCGYLRTESLRIVDFTFGNVDSVVNSNEFYQLKDNAVTLTDNQKITGNKTFTNSICGIYAKNTNLATNGTTPATTLQTLNCIGQANDGSWTGALYAQAQSDGVNTTIIAARRLVNGSNVTANIGVYVDVSGNKRTTTVTPSDTTSTSSNQIATTGWVNSTGNNVVHLSGKETISGAKTFTATPTINGGNGGGQLTIKNNVTTYGTSAVDLVATTSNSKNQFHIHFQEGNKWVGYWTQDPTTKSVTFNIAGCAECYAPTPSSATDNSAKIATTAWCTTASKEGNLIGAPDWDSSKAVSLSSGDSVTANGWIVCSQSQSSMGVIELNGVPVLMKGGATSTSGATIPTKKGDVITIPSGFSATFYPAL